MFRILQLCKKFPYPLKDGESIAVNALSRELVALGCQVSLLAMNTSKHYFDLSKLPLDFNHYNSIYTININNDISYWGIFKSLFQKESYHISRLRSIAFEEKLKIILHRNTFDIIQLETSILSLYIPIIRKYSTAKIVLRSHNIEHEIWLRMARNSSFILKKKYFQLLSQKLKIYEYHYLKEYDFLAAITQKDLDYYKKMGYQNQSMVCPIGIRCSSKLDLRAFRKPLSLSFIGSLDWLPNQEGLLWFMNSVWKKVITKLPKVQLHIAGRNAAQFTQKLKADNIKVHGEVEDAYIFLNQYPVTIVPLLSGSGMRVKILESMALGRTVITTSLGLEGIPAQHKEQVLIADTPQAFLDCILFCKQHPNEIQTMGKAAHQFIERHFDRTIIAKQFITVLKNTLL